MSDPPYTFDAPDANVILRAPLQPDDPGSTAFKDFHTHIVVLSTASTVFRDLFSVPQPPKPTEGDTNLPTIHVAEPAEIFETFLRFLYPIEPPAVNSLQTLENLLQIADKYMAGGVRARLRRMVVVPSFLKSDPIRVYAIACRMDLDEEAKLAISHSYNVDLVEEIPRSVLQAMTAETYNRLLRSHATRRKELKTVINLAATIPCKGKCTCGPGYYTSLKREISLAVMERPVLTREILDSRLSVIRGPKSTCGRGFSCRVSAQAITAFFTRILDGAKRSGQALLW